MTRDGKVKLSKLATIDHRLAELQAQQAELLAQRARIFDALAEDEGTDLTTGRKVARPHVPEIPAVSDTDRQAARKALRDNEHRRRLRA